MYELRILSGLHRGAALPLDDRPHIIGASEDADVVLVDPGVHERHASLSRTPAGWLLSPDEGLVLGADDNRPQSGLELMPGEFARLGKVWMAVTPENAEWEDPPPEPADVFVEPVQEEQASAGPVVDEALAIDAAGADEPPAPVESETPRRSWWMRPGVLVPLSVVTVVAVLCVLVFPPDRSTDRKKPSLESGLAALTAGSAGKGAGNKGTGSTGMNPDQLRAAFRKRLSDADLLQRFDLALNDASWSMRADLDDEETARFERVLKTFLVEHKITFPVSAKVVGPEGMLPFKIRLVVTGRNAAVVTFDGRRIQVGDEYQGVRLASIHGSRLVFVGKRKIELNW